MAGTYLEGFANELNAIITHAYGVLSAPEGTAHPEHVGFVPSVRKLVINVRHYKPMLKGLETHESSTAAGTTRFVFFAIRIAFDIRMSTLVLALEMAPCREHRIRTVTTWMVLPHVSHSSHRSRILHRLPII